MADSSQYSHSLSFTGKFPKFAHSVFVTLTVLPYMAPSGQDIGIHVDSQGQLVSTKTREN